MLGKRLNASKNETKKLLKNWLIQIRLTVLLV